MSAIKCYETNIQAFCISQAVDLTQECLNLARYPVSGLNELKGKQRTVKEYATLS